MIEKGTSAAIIGFVVRRVKMVGLIESQIMSESNTVIDELPRFYKINREGRWHRKTPGGMYEEMKSRAALKRLKVMTAKSLKRIE